jgi:hypothetical protein
MRGQQRCGREVAATLPIIRARLVARDSNFIILCLPEMVPRILGMAQTSCRCVPFLSYVPWREMGRRHTLEQYIGALVERPGFTCAAVCILAPALCLWSSESQPRHIPDRRGTGRSQQAAHRHTEDVSNEQKTGHGARAVACGRLPRTRHREHHR